MAEQLALNETVPGSSPGGRIKIKIPATREFLFPVSRMIFFMDIAERLIGDMGVNLRGGDLRVAE